MKKILFVFLLGCISTTIYAQSTDQYLGELINRQEYFKLKRVLEKTDSVQVNKIVWHMANAFVGTYFYEPENAIKSISILLESYQNQIGEGNTIAMLNLLIENYANMREYNKAAQICESIVKQTVNNNLTHNFYKNMWNAYRAMNGIPKQNIFFSNHHISICKDSIGLMKIPVKDANSKEYGFVFDTGAGFSVIPESLIHDFNIRIIADSVVTTGTSSMRSKLGVADYLYVGDVRVENVLFTILPDSVINIEHGDKQVYHIDGIIGWDLISCFKTVKAEKGGKLTFNTNDKSSTVQGNLMVSSRKPYVEVFSGKDTLVLDLDTGAAISVLSPHYYKKYRNYINQERDTVYKSSGIGGVSVDKALVITNFPLLIGDHCVIPYINVIISDSPHYTSMLPIVDGTLGQNIIGLYDRMIIDIATMSVELKNN